MVVVCISAPAVLKRYVERINCRNQMRAILSVAVHLWPDEHDGYLPSDFASMSNELGVTKLLICPADHTRRPAVDWSSLRPENCTYELVTPQLRKTDTNHIFIRCPIHGYSGYVDERLVDAGSR